MRTAGHEQIFFWRKRPPRGTPPRWLWLCLASGALNAADPQALSRLHVRSKRICPEQQAPCVAVCMRMVTAVGQPILPFGVALGSVLRLVGSTANNALAQGSWVAVGVSASHGSAQIYAAPRPGGVARIRPRNFTATYARLSEGAGLHTLAFWRCTEGLGCARPRG